MAATTKYSKKGPVTPKPSYEFLGPPGAAFISFGLPIVCYAMTFLCNDISGCPVPSLLHPSRLSLAQLKEEAGWPKEGIMGLGSWDATGYTLAYYLLSMGLFRVLPGAVVQGKPLRSGKTLTYKFNALYSTLFTLGLLLAGTIAQGATWPVWTYMWDHYTELLTANIIIAYVLATYVYIASFNVKPSNKELRELALGGVTGNMLYDWFIGRELNPRITLPLLGEFDIKTFNELRPGMMGWLILNFSSMAHQYRTYGYVTDSIVLVCAFQTLYSLDSMWWEDSILNQMDITTDGFGFMLSFGDLVWVPFTYSIQARYLSVYPLTLGITGIAGVLTPLAIGYYIFRSSNNEKNQFRDNPNDPRVAHLKTIETKSGRKLIVSGWWGTARHINYLGDWIQSWGYVLPTGLAGYVIQRTGAIASEGGHVMGVNGVPTGYEVLPGEAKGWGMVVTYFYIVYFAVLLIHRELRDEEACHKKYGDDWARYQKIVKSRIVPYIY